MKNNKLRLVEMMQVVAGVKLNLNEAAEKGTRVLITDVSPETIELKENLPNLRIADASITMSRPEQIIEWKENFINMFGTDGYIEKGKGLDWNWDVVDNENFIAWKKAGLNNIQSWLDNERNIGRRSGLD